MMKTWRAGEAEMDDEEDSDEEARFFCDIEFVTVAMVFVSLHF
jgi:hypothetical protein